MSDIQEQSVNRKELIALADKLEKLSKGANKRHFSPTLHGDMGNGVRMWWLQDRSVSLGTGNSFDADLLCALKNATPKIIAALRELATDPS